MQAPDAEQVYQHIVNKFKPYCNMYKSLVDNPHTAPDAICNFIVENEIRPEIVYEMFRSLTNPMTLEDFTNLLIELIDQEVFNFETISDDDSYLHKGIASHINGEIYDPYELRNKDQNFQTEFNYILDGNLTKFVENLRSAEMYDHRLFMLATLFGADSIFDYFLTNGYEVNDDILSAVIISKKEANISRILQNINEVRRIPSDNPFDTPLYYAVRMNNTEVFNFLRENLQLDVDYWYVAQSMNFELFFQELSQHMDNIQLFFNASFGFKLPELTESFMAFPGIDFYQSIPFAIRSTNLELFNLVFSKVQEIENYEGNQNLYHLCAKYNADKIFKYLVESEYKLDSLQEEDSEGNTPLAYATRYNSYRVMSVFLDMETDPNTSDMFGQTLLHYCAMNDCAETITVLLDHGAEIDAITDEGRSPLHDAVLCASHKSVRVLLERGADRYILDNENYTPLFRALQMRDLFSVNELLKNYNRKLLNNSIIAIPLEYDIDDDDETSDVIHCLWKYDFDITVPLPNMETGVAFAVRTNKPNLARTFLQCGSDIDFIYPDGNSLLHLAISMNAPYLVNVLMEQSADIEVLNKDGKNPLELALELNNEKVLSVLRKFASF